MKTLIRSLILMTFMATKLFAQEEVPRTVSIGSFFDGKYHISAEFGIEQWEDGKLTTHRYQTWYLLCSPETFGLKLPFDTWCSLKRIVIDRSLIDQSLRIISGHNHYVTENTLKLTRIDWPGGRLDFAIVLDDANTIEVALRFKQWKTTLFLESFKAVGIARGIFTDTLSAIEYRIPEYSYVLNIPTEIRGLKSADTKVVEDFEKSLSQTDRVTWSKVSKTIPIFEDALFRRHIPDYEKVDKGERKLTNRDIEVLSNGMRQALTAWLPTTGLSADGQGKVEAYISGVIDSMIQGISKDIQKP